MAWVYLSAAIVIELASTLALKVAVAGRRTWYVEVTVGYLISFVLLSLALHEGMGIGLAYGVWTAVGVALTALASRALFAELLTRTMGLGIGLIAVGVLMLEVASTK